jgi:asparagine synthase (glutamine-hydrolysing)
MCGLAGIVGCKDEVGITRMLESTSHRGPDYCDIFTDDLITFGHNRLSILDLSAAGNQPMISDDGRYVMIYNGEIYNYKSIRNDLEKCGVIFKSKTDSEVLLQLYIKYESDCVKYIRGMFAFAIWDAQKQMLFAARDRHGIKPFYYNYSNGIIRFCSEIKGLVAGINNSISINRKALLQFLTKGCVYPPHTFYNEIKSLLPGESLIWTNGIIQINNYTKQSSNYHTEHVEYDDAVNQVYSHLHHSTEEQMVSDVPLGVFLSGGLDSSVITCAAKKFKSQLDTFSIGFEGKNKQIDESNEAIISAQYFGTKHHQLTIKDNDIREHVEQFIRTIDQPSLDGINSYFISHYASSSVKVALSGLGGDELFMGYSSQNYLLRNTIRKSSSKKVLEMTWEMLPQYFKRRWEVQYCSGNLKKLYATVNRVFSPQEINLILDTSDNIIDKFEDYISDYHFLSNEPEKQISQIDQYLFMGARLREIDVAGMAWSMETRFPMLDERLTNYLISLPATYLMDKNNKSSDLYEKGNIKKLLYDGFKKELPPDFITRNKKGFEMPFHNWMSDTLYSMVKHELNNLHPIFKSKHALLRMLNDELNKGGWIKNWSIFVLNFWLRKNLKENLNI